MATAMASAKVGPTGAAFSSDSTGSPEQSAHHAGIQMTELTEPPSTSRFCPTM
jgi:hypothetical protein